MHIPDGFLDMKTCAATTIVSAGVLRHSMKRTKELLNERQIPALGIMFTFIFAGQMINFPVAAGTSGHLLGAGLATILLGPWNASLIMTTVLIVQCLFFQDGGITVLGANIFNMAIVGVAVSHIIYMLLSKLKVNKYMVTFITAWISVMITAIFASIELAVAGTISLKVVLPAMLGWHTLIGIGEGIITAVVVSSVKNTGINLLTDQIGGR